MLDSTGPLDRVDEEKDQSEDTVFSNCWEVTGCPRSDYMACQAYSQRKNCYQLDRVICCSKHRGNCATCSVYIALNRIPTSKVSVHISTGYMEIEGYVHLPLKMRLSDYMNRDSTSFIALTGTRVTMPGEPDIVTENELVVVNRAHIIIIRPLDEQESGRLAA